MSKFTNCFCSLASLANHFKWLPPLIARITIGAVLIESGWGKLHNLGKVTEFFQSLGIPAAHLQAPFVASIEFGAGILILLGLLTRIASVPLIGIMAVAIITAKREDISSLTDIFGLSEFLYIVLLVWLVIEGAGWLSLDRLFQKKS